MLEIKSNRVNYSICKYEYQEVGGNIILHNLDNDICILINEEAQLIWNMLVAAYRGSCDISDKTFVKIITRKYNIPINSVLEIIRYVDFIISLFVSNQMLRIF